MESIKTFFTEYLSWLQLPTFSSIDFSVIDLLEILILSFLIYHILIWIRETRAWTLLKGMLLLVCFIAMAYVFEMDTIQFIISKGLDLSLTALVVIFQPELRKALEQLGEKKIIESLIPIDAVREVKELFSDKTINELVKGTVEMAKVKTGALIVLEQNETLAEYERTGIALDSIVTSQLLINIFEHNTPLHDGAIIVRGNRIVSATCYLPLSDNMALSKELGTRHRAGVGISEVTDSLTIIVSEETGTISLASKGKLTRDVTAQELRERLIRLQNKKVDTKKFRLWKGKGRNEKNSRTE